MKDRHRLFVAYVSLILFSIIGTTASKFLKLDPGPVAPAAGFCLILVGACIVGLEVGAWKAAIAPIVIGAASEIIGLYTGIPFGRYEYTGTWWPSIPIGGGHVFPLLLPFAWLMSTGGAYLSLRRWLGKWSLVIASSLLATMIDAPMERAMVSVFRYWKWNENGPIFGAPIANSIGWFFVSLLCLRILDLNSERIRGVLYSGRVLGLFCLFTAISGAIAFADPAWLILSVFGFGLTLSKTF